MHTSFRIHAVLDCFTEMDGYDTKVTLNDLEVSLKDIKKNLRWLYDVVNRVKKKELLHLKKSSGWGSKWETIIPGLKTITETYMSLWEPLDT